MKPTPIKLIQNGKFVFTWWLHKNSTQVRAVFGKRLPFPPNTNFVHDIYNKTLDK